MVATRSLSSSTPEARRLRSTRTSAGSLASRGAGSGPRTGLRRVKVVTTLPAWSALASMAVAASADPGHIRFQGATISFYGGHIRFESRDTGFESADIRLWGANVGFES